jgi:hypothetical protein
LRDHLLVAKPGGVMQQGISRLITPSRISAAFKQGLKFAQVKLL